MVSSKRLDGVIAQASFDLFPPGGARLPAQATGPDVVCLSCSGELDHFAGVFQSGLGNLFAAGHAGDFLDPLIVVEFDNGGAGSFRLNNLLHTKMG